jgi:uncharacterized membrane protein YdjX (TVP38/TMEM64 family)
MDFGNIQELSTYIHQFGIYAPIVAFILFVIQAAFPVFPYFILAAAGGILFGFKLGVLLSWLGALTGACFAYWMCRLLGYTRLLQWYYHRLGYDARQLDSTLAFWTIVAARIIPVIPTPLINAAAALGGVPFLTFLTSSAIGKLPLAVIYTGLGLALFKAKDFQPVLAIVGITIIMLIFIRVKVRNILPRNIS